MPIDPVAAASAHQDPARPTNDRLTPADWAGLGADVRDAFTGPVKLIVLPAGFGLYKLSHAAPAARKDGFITGWWSSLEPFREDDEGARGRFEQARLNGINMSAMVRYMSAVSVDWNELDRYIEVRTQCELKAFWGRFAPQKFHSSGKRPPEPLSEALKRALGNAELPDDLGALEAWQFYIPYLEERHVETAAVVAAYDMAALAAHFRL